MFTFDNIDCYTSDVCIHAWWGSLKECAGLVIVTCNVTVVTAMLPYLNQLINLTLTMLKKMYDENN